MMFRRVVGFVLVGCLWIAGQSFAQETESSSLQQGTGKLQAPAQELQEAAVTSAPTPAPQQPSPATLEALVATLERHLQARYSISLRLRLAGTELTNGDASTLILHSARLIPHEGHYLLECSISRTAWETQRTALTDLVTWYQTQRVMAQYLPAAVSTGYAILKTDLTQTGLNSSFWTSLGKAILISLGCSIPAALWEARCRGRIRLLNKIVADPTRIPGFVKIGETQHTIFLRTDTTIDNLPA